MPMPTPLCDRPLSSAKVGRSDNGDTSCLLNARSLKDVIPTSCLSRPQGGTVLISKEIVAVLDLRNNWRRPLVNPDKLRTTVAIIDNLTSPCDNVCETKYGIINA
jgi:hypothetical protein